jgi:hypothetical protein
MSERVVEFGDTRYEFVEDAQGGHWWPDVTPQERDLIEELERQQAGMRALLAQRAELADAVRSLAEEEAASGMYSQPGLGLTADDVINVLAEPARSLLRQLLGEADR